MFYSFPRPQVKVAEARTRARPFDPIAFNYTQWPTWYVNVGGQWYFDVYAGQNMAKVAQIRVNAISGVATKIGIVSYALPAPVYIPEAQARQKALLCVPGGHVYSFTGAVGQSRAYWLYDIVDAGTHKLVTVDAVGAGAPNAPLTTGPTPFF